MNITYTVGNKCNLIKWDTSKGEHYLCLALYYKAKQRSFLPFEVCKLYYVKLYSIVGNNVFRLNDRDAYGNETIGWQAE